MSLYVLSSAIADPNDLNSLVENPDFRRATGNMKLAYLAGCAALKSLPAGTNLDNVGLIVGTSFGELNSTCDFLSGLALENVGRPLAFQNSLHHSTLGFLSRTMKVTGPGFTVSREYFSGEDAIELARVLIEEEVDYVLVVGVDTVVDRLADSYQERYKNRGGAYSGASAILFSKHKGTSEFELSEIKYNLPGSPWIPGEVPGYDSDSVAKISLALDSVKEDQTFHLPKPDGSSTQVAIRWHKANV